VDEKQTYNNNNNNNNGLFDLAATAGLVTKSIYIQGGPKKPDQFWMLITFNTDDIP